MKLASRVALVVCCLASFRGYAYLFSRAPTSFFLLKQAIQPEHGMELVAKQSDHVTFLKENLDFCDTDIRKICEKYPKLFSFDIDSNLAPTVEVFRSFGFRNKELRSMLRISPQVFSLNSEWSIPEKLLEIQQTFEFSCEELIKIVTQYPILLSFRKERHAELLAFFTETIGIPGGRGQLRTLVLRYRQLIGTSLKTLRSAWTELRDTLGFSQRVTCRLVTLHPSLLSRKVIDTIPKRLELFTEQLGLSPPPFNDMQSFLLKEPLLLKVDIDTVLSPNLFLLRALLKFPEPDLRHFLRGNPSLLVLPPFRLKKKLFALLYLMTGDISYIQQANATVIGHATPRNTLLSDTVHSVDDAGGSSEYAIRMKRLEQMLSVHMAQPRSTAQSLTLLFENDDDEGEIEFMEVVENAHVDEKLHYKRRNDKKISRNNSTFFLQNNKKQSNNELKTASEEMNEEVGLMTIQDMAAVQAMLQQYSSTLSSSTSFSPLVIDGERSIPPQEELLSETFYPSADIFSQRKRKSLRPIGSNNQPHVDLSEEKSCISTAQITTDAQYTPFFETMINAINHQQSTHSLHEPYAKENLKKYDLLHEFFIDRTKELDIIGLGERKDVFDDEARLFFFGQSTPMCVTFDDTQHILKTAPQIMLKRVSAHVKLLSSLAVSLALTKRELSRIVRIMPRMLNLSVDGKVFATINNLAQLFLDFPSWILHYQNNDNNKVEGFLVEDRDMNMDVSSSITTTEDPEHILRYRAHPMRAALRELLLRYPHVMVHSLNHVTDRLMLAQQLHLSVQQLPQILRRSQTQHSAYIAKQ